MNCLTSRKKGCLVTGQHEAVKQELIASSKVVFEKSCVSDRPTILHCYKRKVSSGVTAVAIPTLQPKDRPRLQLYLLTILDSKHHVHL